jgi:hypothetical protein
VIGTQFTSGKRKQHGNENVSDEEDSSQHSSGKDPLLVTDVYRARQHKKVRT